MTEQIAPLAPQYTQRVVRIPVYRQLKKIGAFADAGQIQIAQVIPPEQVGRTVQHVARTVQIERHQPLVGGVVPDYFGIAVGSFNMSEHRIVSVFGPRAAAIVAVGQTLRKGHRIGSVCTGRRIEGDQRRLAPLL